MLYIKEVDFLKHDLLQNQMCALLFYMFKRLVSLAIYMFRYLKVMKDNFKYYISS